MTYWISACQLLFASMVILILIVWQPIIRCWRHWTIHYAIVHVLHKCLRSFYLVSLPHIYSYLYPLTLSLHIVCLTLCVIYYYRCEVSFYRIQTAVIDSCFIIRKQQHETCCTHCLIPGHINPTKSIQIQRRVIIAYGYTAIHNLI